MSFIFPVCRYFNIPSYIVYTFIKNSRLEKYEAKEKIRVEIEEQAKKAKLFAERNQLAEVDRAKKFEAELNEQIKAYLRVTEEDEEEEKDAEIPPLPELTDEMQVCIFNYCMELVLSQSLCLLFLISFFLQNEIDKALSARPDQVLVSAFNLTIKGRDMVTLKPLAWLNDEVGHAIYVFAMAL